TRCSAFRSNGLPNKLTDPESGTVIPIIIRIELVFPDPFGPSSPNIVPGSMVSDRPSTATFVSYTLRIFSSSTIGMRLDAFFRRQLRLVWRYSGSLSQRETPHPKGETPHPKSKRRTPQDA